LAWNVNSFIENHHNVAQRVMVANATMLLWKSKNCTEVWKL